MAMYRYPMAVSVMLLLGGTARAVDETNLVTLPGNTHIAARPQFDQGAVADDYFLPHIQLLLKRSPAGERTLEEFIDRLHDPASTDFHRWLTAEDLAGDLVQRREISTQS